MYAKRTINTQLIVFHWLVSSYIANLKKVGTSFYPISISKTEWTFVQNCTHGLYLLPPQLTWQTPTRLQFQYCFGVSPLRRLP